MLSIEIEHVRKEVVPCRTAASRKTIFSIVCPKREGCSYSENFWMSWQQSPETKNTFACTPHWRHNYGYTYLMHQCYIHTYQVTPENLICNHGPKGLTQCAKHSAQSSDVGHSVFPFKFFKLD